MTESNPIDALLPESNIVLGLPSADKAGLLTMLARIAEGLTGLPASVLARKLDAREQLGSTGIGGGIAIPHARIEGLLSMAAVLARLEKPIPFDAIDGRPVDLVVLLLSPAGDDRAHLAALAAITRRLRLREVRAAVRAARTVGEMREAVLGGV